MRASVAASKRPRADVAGRPHVDVGAPYDSASSGAAVSMMPALLTATYPARSTRIGASCQLAALPPAVPLAPMAALTSPPCCRCGEAAAWRLGRWWCARRLMADEGTACRGTWCEFEMPPPPTRPPVCACDLPAAWVRVGFFCASNTCDFVHRPSAPRPEPTLVTSASAAQEAAAGVARLLTAAAFGPMNAWSFVAPSDCGLGLFARVPLAGGQLISEYAGPRLCEPKDASDTIRRGECTLARMSWVPLPARALSSVPAWCPSRLPHSRRDEESLQAQLQSLMMRTRLSHADCLQIPDSQYVIDGACENCEYTLPSLPAIFANHSTNPNARLETWPVRVARIWDVPPVPVPSSPSHPVACHVAGAAPGTA